MPNVCERRINCDIRDDSPFRMFLSHLREHVELIAIYAMIPPFACSWVIFGNTFFGNVFMSREWKRSRWSVLIYLWLSVWKLNVISYLTQQVESTKVQKMSLFDCVNWDRPGLNFRCSEWGHRSKRCHSPYKLLFFVEAIHSWCGERIFIDILLFIFELLSDRRGNGQHAQPA